MARSVSVAATIRPLCASIPTCSFLHERRFLVPCFSISHSPGLHSFSPVLSTSRWSAPLAQGCVPGSVTVRARRAMVE